MQKLIYGIGAALALLIVVGVVLPRTHRIEVTTEIDASAATVFALINDFRRFSAWAPSVHSDPDARISYSGPLRGEGAIMAWEGAVIGVGAQLITQSHPYESVSISINPGDPGEAHSWFQLRRGTGTTVVTWGLEVDYGLNIVARYFASMLGTVVARDYQAGLEALRELAESLPKADFGDIRIDHINVEANDIAYLSSTSRPEPTAISESMGKAYFKVLTFIDENDLSDSGSPLSISRNFNGSELAFDAGIPVEGLNESTPRNESGVKIGRTYAGPVVRAEHIGSYRSLSSTHRKVSAYLAALAIERNGAAWESYVSDPGRVPEHQLVTYVYYPIREN